MATLLARRLIALRKRRDERQRITRKPLPRNWWEAVKPEGRLYLGLEAVYDERARVKYVSRQSPVYPYTWGELSREWLRAKCRQLGIGKSPVWTGAYRNADIPPALAFIPGSTPGRWAYCDIKACYGTLLGRWPLQTRYIHEFDRLGAHLFLPQGPVLPVRDLIADKNLRLGVWGTIRGTELQWRSGSEIKTSRTAGRLAQPGIAGMVLVVVHEIAERAIRDFGARMWLTDAAILPAEQVEGFRACLAAYGLRAEVKAEGTADLKGIASYRVGRKRSRVYPNESGPINTILPSLPWRDISAEVGDDRTAERARTSGRDRQPRQAGVALPGRTVQAVVLPGRGEAA